MQKMENAAINPSTGLPVAGPTVTVFHAGTSTKPTIYADEAGTTKPNPFTGDTHGRFWFYAHDGDYDVKIEGAGLTPYILADVTLGDPKRGGYAVTDDRLIALLANAYYNRATATFERLSTARPSWAAETDSISDYLRILRAAAGTGSITWAELLRVLPTGGLVLPTVGPAVTQQHALPAVASDTVALLAATQTLAAKTLTSPAIADFTNAQHAHAAAGSGGQVSHGSLTGVTADQHHARSHALDSAADHSGTLTDAQLASGVTQTGGASKIVKTDAAGRVRLGAAPDNGLDAATKAYVDELVFRPTNLAGLKLWLDANEISGLADGDPVATWSDLSGNGNHATQGTAANRPIYKVGILNGGPVVRLDGSNDFMATAAFAAALTQPTYIVMVAKMDTPEGTGVVVYDGIASGNRHGLIAETTGTPDNYQIFAGAPVSFLGAAFPKGAFKIFAVDFNTTASTLYENGAVIGTGNSGTHTLTGLTLGARFAYENPLQGDMAEVLIINPTPTAAQRLRLNRYLSHKHAIALAG